METVRRQISPLIEGRRIVAAYPLAQHRHLSGLDKAAGLYVSSVRRAGKVLIADLASQLPGSEHDSDVPCGLSSELELVVHLGMSGRLVVASGPDPKNLRAAVTFDGGLTLWFVDARRFGRMMVCEPGVYPTLPMLSELGPDLLSVDDEQLFSALTSTRRTVKAALLDQRLIAGAGNIYVDESLWYGRVAPERLACDVSEKEVRAIRSALVDVSMRSIDAGGTTFRDYRDSSGEPGSFASNLAVYSRSGLPCLRCRRPLVRSVVAGRGTVWCSSCQV